MSGALVSAATATLLAHCSLFVDTDGLSDGDETDAAEDAADKGDANSSDSEWLGDARDANTLIFTCDGGHAVCDDFDTDLGNPPWPAWSSVTRFGVSTLEIDEDGGIAASAAAHSAGVADGAVSPAAAALVKTLSLPASAVHCEMQVRVAEGGPQVLLLTFSSGTGDVKDYFLRVNLGASGGEITTGIDRTDAGGTYNGTALPPLLAASLVPVDIDLASSSGAEQVTIAVGGVVAATYPFPAPPGTPLTQIILGDDYSQAPFDMLFDDVLCDVSP